MGDERVREAGHVAAGDLAIGKEGGIDIGHIHRSDHVLDAPRRAVFPGLPFLPAVDVGQKQRRAVRPGNVKAHHLGIFLPVRHFERRHHQRAHGSRLAIGYLFQGDVLIAHQLVPGPVGEQVGGHGGHDMHRHMPGAHALMAQIHQPGVMAHMAMGQEDPVQRRSLGIGMDLVQPLHLLAQVRRGIKEKARIRRPVDHRDRGRQPPQRGILPGRVVRIADLRDAGILGDAQHHQLDRTARWHIGLGQGRGKKQDGRGKRRQNLHARTGAHAPVRVKPHQSTPTTRLRRCNSTTSRHFPCIGP